jgi:hypothetical protein
MKILGLSDIHGDDRILEKALELAVSESVDVIMLAGDLTNFDNIAKNIIKPLKTLNKPILVVPGNHDSMETIDQIAQKYDILNIHGKTQIFGDIGIIGIGGALEGPIYAVSEQRIDELISREIENIKHLKKKIILSHIFPSQSKMSNLSNIVSGSNSLYKRIKEFNIDLVVCGHIHEASGLEEKIGNAKVVNVSKKPTIIEIN